MRELDEYEDDVIELGREVLAGESDTGYSRLEAIDNLIKHHYGLFDAYLAISASGNLKPLKDAILRSACDLVEDYYKQGGI